MTYIKDRPFECLVFIICSLVSAYFVIGLNIEQNLLIGNADQSNMANLARNIAEGNGAVVDNIWLMLDGGVPGNSVTHAEPYWSVYVAYMIAPFFKVFGSSRLVLILPALLIHIMIVGVVAWSIDKVAPRKKLPAILGIVLASFSIPMLNSITGFSDIYLTLFILLSGITLVYAISMQKWSLFFLAGILAGVAVAIKPSGLLLLGVWPIYFVFCNGRKTIFRNLIIFLTGLLFGLAPYIVYNQSNFGSFLPPGLSLAGKASTIRDAIIVNEKNILDNKVAENKWGHAHRKGFYNPDSKPIKRDFSSVLQIEKRIEWLKTFIRKSFIWGQLLPIWLLPFVLIGVFEIFIRLKSSSSITKSSTNLFLIFCILMLISGFVLAIRVSFEVRYWNYMVPLLIVVSVMGAMRLPKAVSMVLIVFSLYTGTSYLLNHEGLKKSTPAYAKAMDILPDNAQVFTSSPWQFAFHTRLPSVMLPYTDNSKTIHGTADRYGVEYLAIVDNDTKHPYYTQLQEAKPFDYLDLIYRDDHLILYKFKN